MHKLAAYGILATAEEIREIEYNAEDEEALSQAIKICIGNNRSWKKAYCSIKASG